MTDDNIIYERFRLSRQEFFIIQRIYNQYELGVVLAPKIHREWEEAWSNDDYPFRNDDRDEAPVIGAIIQEMPL